MSLIFQRLYADAVDIHLDEGELTGAPGDRLGRSAIA